MSKEDSTSESIYRTVVQGDGSVATFADIADSAASDGVPPPDRIFVSRVWMGTQKANGGWWHYEGCPNSIEYVRAYSPTVDEAARRAAEKIAPHLDPWDLGFNSTHVAEIIIAELKETK